MTLPPRVKDGPHIRLSQNFFDDADEEGLDHLTAYLYARMAAKVRQLRSDGWVHEAHVSKFGVPAWRRRIADLVHVGWVCEFRDDRGRSRWYLPAYAKWNPLEDDYVRRVHEGRTGGCTAKHEQPCQATKCVESRAWLTAHPQVPLQGGVQGGVQHPL